MRDFFTKKRILIGVGALVVILSGWAIWRGNGNGVEFLTVKRGEVVDIVKVTGRVKAYGEVDLGFDTGGRVARSFAEVGDRVEAGDTIATLDLAQILAELAKERATLDQETSELEEVRKNAPASLSQAEENLVAAITEAYSSMDNAIRNKTDQFFKTPRTNPIFEISITDGNFVHYFDVPTDTALDLANRRRAIESILTKWHNDVGTIKRSNASNLAISILNDMNTISSFLDRVSLAVNSFVSSDYDYDTTVNGYKTAVDAARSSIASAKGKVITAQQSLSSSPIIGESGSVSSVASQEARVNQVRSSVAALEASLRKSSITAPFSGVVTRQDAKVGETVSAGESLVSIISEDRYVEANVSEINIGKVSVGNKVKLKFDAFPGLVLAGEISFVEPGETIVDSIVNYKIRITSVEFGENIKSGLTVDAEIETAKKEDVIFLPSFAIVREEEVPYVYKVEDRKVFKTNVATGLVGSDGSTEIVSGLSEGDIVQFVK